jgi:hypothetical protein
MLRNLETVTNNGGRARCGEMQAQLAAAVSDADAWLEDQPRVRRELFCQLEEALAARDFIPHRRAKSKELPAWKEARNRSHKRVRARAEHTCARMRSWKVLRDCRLKGDSVHYAMLGIARLYNLALTG